MFWASLPIPPKLGLRFFLGKWASLGEVTMDAPHPKSEWIDLEARQIQTVLLLAVGDLRLHHTHSTAKPHVSSMAVSSLS